MAKLTYTTHPDSNQFTYNITVAKGSDEAVLFYFITPHRITSLSTITVPEYISNSNAQTQWRWNNTLTWVNSGYYQGNDRQTGLINSFNTSKQILCARVQCTNKTGTSARPFTLTMPSITGTGDVSSLSTISAGTPLYQPMVDLKDYVDQLATQWNKGTNLIITLPPSSPETIKPAHFTSYITKINQLPFVNTPLTIPNQNDKVNASYYNNIVNTICPS